MSMDERGSDTPLVPPLELRAGPLRMIFELQSSFLRYVKLGERGVYAAVRDRNWGTIPPQISHLQTRIGKQSFDLQFEARHCKSEIDLVWQGELSGFDKGTIIDCRLAPPNSPAAEYSHRVPARR